MSSRHRRRRRRRRIPSWPPERGAGAGSVRSPAERAKASRWASTECDKRPAEVIAGFSSAGPTPVSLQMKRDVTAPGVDILSFDARDTGRQQTERTRMETRTWRRRRDIKPAASDLDRRPGQVRARRADRRPVHATVGLKEIGCRPRGWRRIDRPRADNPLISFTHRPLDSGSCTRARPSRSRSSNRRRRRAAP